MRIELTTYSLGSCRSATELRPRANHYNASRVDFARKEVGFQIGLKCFESFKP